MSDTVMELILLAGAAMVLLAGDAETYKMAVLRVVLVMLLVACAVTVWALARFWS